MCVALIVVLPAVMAGEVTVISGYKAMEKTFVNLARVSDAHHRIDPTHSQIVQDLLSGVTKSGLMIWRATVVPVRKVRGMHRRIVYA